MISSELYRAVAVTRAKELPTRLGLALFIGAIALVLTQTVWPLVWFGAVILAQVFDGWVFNPLKAEDAPPPGLFRHALCIASAALNTAVYSGIAAYIWFAGGEPGKLFAIVQTAGGLLHIALHMHSVRSLLFAAAVPHMSYLLGLPLVNALVTPQKDLLPMAAVTCAGLLYVLHLVVAVRRTSAVSAEMRQARDEAQSERLRAEQASAAKSNFLATISHEIRTPLNAVVAAGALLGRTRLSKAQAEHVAMLGSAGEVLLGLLNDVLDLSKIESGKLQVEAAEFAIRDKLEASVQLWSPRAAEKGVELVARLAGDLPARVVTDPLRLQQIVFNLLSNAVKFTDQGRVELSAGLANGRLWLEVADSGCGMSPEVAARVFDSFEQASASTSRQRGGTGLGLAISRQLAEIMDGDLSVRSIVGEGSTFRLELPVTVVEAAEPAAAPESEMMLEGLEVLLADDHPVNQRIVRLYLEPLGCRVTAVGDGGEAVEAAALRPFDLILMDMQMPLVDGVEATRRIRAIDGPNATTPVFALTANAMQEHRDRWLAVGVDVFLTKPLDMALLLQAVAGVSANERAAA
ncbi:MAG TPA: ATP-binding protein [Phenylobacterium sp.]|nr:ATP-binding protein [Phenylobacterium sp.]